MNDESDDAALFNRFVGCDYLQTFMRDCCVGSTLGLALVREHRICVGAFNLKPYR